MASKSWDTTGSRLNDHLTRYSTNGKKGIKMIINTINCQTHVPIVTGVQTMGGIVPCESYGLATWLIWNYSYTFKTVNKASF